MTGIEQILLGFRDDYGVVRQIQPLLVKDIETRAVRHLHLSIHSNAFLSSEHGVQVQFLHFSMNFVYLFVRQLPKIISKMESKCLQLTVNDLRYFLFFKIGLSILLFSSREKNQMAYE